MYNKMVMVKYTAEQTLTSNTPLEIAGDLKNGVSYFFMIAVLIIFIKNYLII